MYAKKLLEAVLALGLLAYMPLAFGCADLYEGVGVRHAELVRTAQVIVLVRAEGSVSDNGLETFRLRRLETLKGKAASTYKMQAGGQGGEASENDFDLHRTSAFWSEDIGRSQYYCCLCGPDHRFRSGATCLLFPDKLGAMKSAELILAPADEWLAFVRAKAGSAVHDNLPSRR